MKKIKYLIMGLVTVFGAASCADFLEVEPKDRVTGNALLSSDGGINAYMAGHYYNLPIEDFRYDFTGGGYNVGRCDGGKTNMMSGPEGATSPARPTVSETGRRFTNTSADSTNSRPIFR